VPKTRTLGSPTAQDAPKEEGEEEEVRREGGRDELLEGGEERLGLGNFLGFPGRVRGTARDELPVLTAWVCLLAGILDREGGGGGG